MSLEELCRIIDSKQERADSGIIDYVPILLEHVRDRMPGFVKGGLGIITANSGVGKSKISKALFVNILADIYSMPESIDYVCIWFALEESEEEFWTSVLSYLLNYVHGLRVSPSKLSSVGKSLDPEIRKLCDDSRVVELYAYIKSRVRVCESIYNPYGIYFAVRAFAWSRGKFYLDNVELTEEDQLRTIGYNRYEPYNPNEVISIVVDHVSLMTKEQSHDNLLDAIRQFSNEYCLKKMAKVLKYVVVLVQQQKGDGDLVQTTSRGDVQTILMEPSTAKLGDCKYTERDARWILGIFNPFEYGIATYQGYDITKLRDSARFLQILKDRDFGNAGSRISIVFFGACNRIAKLPAADSDQIRQVYDKFSKF
jgi:hypothetical protein